LESPKNSTGDVKSTTNKQSAAANTFYDEMGSPLDTDLAHKKRLKIFSKPAGINQAQEATNFNKPKVVAGG